MEVVQQLPLTVAVADTDRLPLALVGSKILVTVAAGVVTLVAGVEVVFGTDALVPVVGVLPPPLETAIARPTATRITSRLPAAAIRHGRRDDALVPGSVADGGACFATRPLDGAPPGAAVARSLVGASFVAAGPSAIAASPTATVRSPPPCA
jgi:hypothetical protein